MYIPSESEYQEIISVPHLVRMTLARKGNVIEPILIIRATAHLIKYILHGAKLEILLFHLPDLSIVYAIQIWDDAACPVSFWSIAGSEQERDAFLVASREGRLNIQLFNEACINVAGSSAEATFGPGALSVLQSGRVVSVKTEEVSAAVCEQLEARFRSGEDKISLNPSVWDGVINDYITNSGERCEVSFLGTEEGAQQENLAQLLTESLLPSGVYLNPQLHEPSGNKEFTDLLLSYEKGSFAIESKTLSIFGRKSRPDREKLARDTIKKTKEGIRQLTVAARKLHDGEAVFDKISGEEIALERVNPVHAICLVPDLGLLGSLTLEPCSLLRQFSKRNSDFLHVMDTCQLFRAVQAAHMLSLTSKELSRLQCFNYILIERFSLTAKINKFDFDMVFDLKSSPPRIRVEH